MNLEHILEELVKLVKDVKVYIDQESKNFSKQDIELKGKNDLVSYVDKTSEKKIVDGCRKIFPDAGFIAEEGTAERGDEYNWIIDPLDGTTNFTHGIPVFAISVALARGEDILLGVVYEINRDECFTAIQGKGAYLNNQPIKVSSVENLSESLIATGFPYHDFGRMEDYMKILVHFMKNTHGVRRLGSAAIDLAYVACGRFEGFFEYNLKPWDIAAGALLVKEAGGNISTFNHGNQYLFTGEILAANSIHGEMSRVITTNW